MSKVQMLRVFVNQRLSAAAEEIFELFERTILEYEEKLCGAKENQHKQKKTNYTTDIQQLLVGKEGDPPGQQERNSSLDQYGTPEPQIIKEEQEELWSSQEGEQLQGLKEAGVNMLIITPVPVKSEEEGDGEELQSSQLYENQTKKNIDTEFLKTEAGLADCAESEPDFNPDSYLRPISDGETSESETEAGLTTLENSEAPVGDGHVTEETSVSFSSCATKSGQKNEQHKNNRIQRNEKTFSCSVCSATFSTKEYLSVHMKYHTKEKKFSCSVCKKSFPRRVELRRHMRVHTGEKPFGCSVCGRCFSHKFNLYKHYQVHTGEKPFSCSFCGRNFARKSYLSRHLKVHRGEKPFSCSECTAVFLNKNDLVVHMRTHTGEKPFMCSVCGRRFTRSVTLKHHLMVHRGEKPFNCSVCDKRFTFRAGLIKHKCKGTVLS
ncbi:uncharacterized protein LOC109989011 [Xyrichtys novacula]|uniref:Uncharacterized protein LOC109989011 n=1 Tax=Xyrichtys novacula TaxID=13765 RepID=A0AAV1HDG9_XYRNO|nr:uncharacterized protein LOC109989011 [Xyrichtys novacula]